MKLVFFGLSLSSSWGNGHATTYRSLLRALAARGHDIIFYEEDVPWYAENRDLPKPDFCRLKFYRELSEIDPADIAGADAVTIGSYVTRSAELACMAAAEGVVTAFYDIDTPVTVTKLDKGGADYLARETVPLFDVYFSFTGGPIMRRIEARYGARRVELLGCSADPEIYAPSDEPREYALGYLGTYDPSRQPALEKLLIEPARKMPGRRFIVAGPQYPDDIDWPGNVERIDHLPPAEHAGFYNSLEFALNVTRADMVAAGYSPSVRIFEAAACGRPVITDVWPGLDTFFEPEAEILLAESAEDVIAHLEMSENEREAIGGAGRHRVLRDHVAAVRAETFEEAVREAADARSIARLEREVPA
jgi:spore maturation protein CgeB